MHHTKSKPQTETARSSGWFLLAALALAASPLAQAQSMVAPAINTTELSTPVANPANAAPTPVASSSSARNPLSWGPFTLHPQISARYLSTDGLQVQPGRKARTDITSFSPGLSAELGRHWSLRYVQTFNRYSNEEFRDTVDQAGGINWQTQYDALHLFAGHDYTRSDSALIETSAQTRQTTHNSSLNILYALSEGYALDTTLSQSLLFNDLYSDSRTWTAREMVHKKFSPFLEAAVGGQYGYTAIKKSPDIGSTQLLVSLGWKPNDFFNVALEAGLENRHIYSKTPLDKRSPVFNGSINYIPSTSTQVSLTASRASSASLFDNLITVTTVYGLNLQKHLFKRFTATAACNRQITDYKSTLADLGTARKDTTDTFNVGLSTPVFKHFSLSVSYRYSSNASNILAYKFFTNQYGIELGYSF